MKKIFLIATAAFVLISISSCKKYLDVNRSPNLLPAEEANIAQLLSSATANIGFTGGSDLHRFTALIMQQYSGQSTGAQNQTQDYEKYLISPTDANNVFASIYATTLNDLELIIKKGTDLGAPHYTGVAKLLKAYTYQIAVDTWGDLPYSEAQLQIANLSPKSDDDEQIYKNLLTIINEGITEINQATSSTSPGTNSLIYPGTFSATRANWLKFANTLKLRLYLHYSKADKAFLTAQMTALVNASGPFLASNADNFEMRFFNESRRQNPIHQFEIDRQNYLFANKQLVDSMNSREDPRRAFYFTQFPAGSGLYAGAKAGDPASQLYSRLHIYLRGAVTNTPVALPNGSYNATAISYTGDAPIRMLTFAEYNFIRAEAALYGVPGDAQTFFQEGIRASMQNAGVATATITSYLAVHGTLTGTNEDKLKRIIQEKYVAGYGVIVEPWTDWRRTGYPQIAAVANAVPTAGGIPRSLFYAQNEIDLNPNSPRQKANLQVRTFWDK